MMPRHRSRALMKINQDRQHTDDIGVAPQPTTISVPPFANRTRAG